MKQILSLIFFVVIWRIAFGLVSDFVGLFLQYHLLFDLFVLLLTGLVSLVLAKLAFDLLARQEDQYLPPKRRALLVSGLTIFFVSVFAFNYWDDHREKNLQAVMNTYNDPANVQFFNPSMNSRKVMEEENEIEPLMNFIGQYKVKKIDQFTGPRKVYELSWDNDPLFDGPSTVHVMIMKDMVRVNEHLYEVVDETVDMEWIEHYYQNDVE